MEDSSPPNEEPSPTEASKDQDATTAGRKRAVEKLDATQEPGVKDQQDELVAKAESPDRKRQAVEGGRKSPPPLASRPVENTARQESEEQDGKPSATGATAGIARGIVPDGLVGMPPAAAASLPSVGTLPFGAYTNPLLAQMMLRTNPSASLPTGAPLPNGIAASSLPSGSAAFPLSANPFLAASAGGAGLEPTYLSQYLAVLQSNLQGNMVPTIHPSLLSAAGASIFFGQNSMAAGRQISRSPQEGHAGAPGDTPVTSGRSPGDGDTRRGPILYTPVDDDVLSDYQTLLRKQIEFFAAQAEDVESTTPGRRKSIVLGQVGIRCRHCAHLPLCQRTKGSVYYPSKLRGLYQAAQNMTVSHLCESCNYILPAVRGQLRAYNEGKTSAGYGGKQYWADSAKAQGIEETEDKGLRFARAA